MFESCRTIIIFHQFRKKGNNLSEFTSRNNAVANVEFFMIISSYEDEILGENYHFHDIEKN